MSQCSPDAAWCRQGRPHLEETSLPPKKNLPPSLPPSQQAPHRLPAKHKPEPSTSKPAPQVVTVTKEPVATVTIVERVPSGGSNYVYGPRRMCGSSVGVNSTTSCPFARNVWQATTVSRSTSSTGAYSPVTGKWYDLRCSSNERWLICRGGVNAEVFMKL